MARCCWRPGLGNAELAFAAETTADSCPWPRVVPALPRDIMASVRSSWGLRPPGRGASLRPLKADLWFVRNWRTCLAVNVLCTFVYQEVWRGTSLAVQPRASNAGAVGSIPGQGTKIPHVAWCSWRKKGWRVPRLWREPCSPLELLSHVRKRLLQDSNAILVISVNSPIFQSDVISTFDMLVFL